MMRRGTSSFALSHSSSSKLGVGTKTLDSKAATTVSRRFYMPIWADGAPADALGPSRVRDESASLWPSPVMVPTLAAGVETWTRLGNDPVLQTQLHPKSSPFGAVEDYAGTNLIHPTTPEHMKESVLVWTEYYRKKYAAALRHSRRTAANYIGVITAQESFIDEADKPETVWDQDTYFKEVSLFADKILHEQVANLEQFEVALRRSDAAKYLQFHDVFATQTQTMLPIPCPSIWVYEGEQRKSWAEKFKPLEIASVQFFEEKLRPASQKKPWDQIAKDIAAVFQQVGKILVQRAERQGKAGIRKPWATLCDAEKEKIAASDVVTRERSILDGEFDSEDSLDKSEEWMHEQAAIQKLLSSPLGDYGFTADEFWQHAIRIEELRTEHVYTDIRARSVATAARIAMYNGNLTVHHLVDSLVDSIAKSTLDLRSATVIPNFNDTWCRLHWTKYASSTIAHHTTTAKRQLLYHQYDNVRLVSAAASVYYRTKPLSSELDYSTPFKYRQSLVQLCAKYGVEYSYAIQRPMFGAAGVLNRAEETIRAVVGAVAAPLGAIRRHAQDTARRNNAAKVTPVTQVHIPAYEDPTKREEQWALGTVRKVTIQWPAKAIVELQRNPGVGADAVLNELNLKKKGHIQIALMRKIDDKKSTVDAVTAQYAARDKLAADTVKQVPVMEHIVASAKQTFARLTGLEYPANAASLGLEAEKSIIAANTWKFATMLDDSVPLSTQDTVELVLPFQTCQQQPITPGVYCLRVRCFEYDAPQNEYDSTKCSEIFSEPFTVFDALPQLTQEFFKLKSPNEIATTLKTFAGSNLVDFCQFLRNAQMCVPTKFEFNVGQNVSPTGDIYYFDHFRDVLHSGRFTPNGCRDRYTSAQRDAEVALRAHWELYHPGASEEEWQGAKRAVLDHAFNREKDWWIPDDMLVNPEMDNLLSSTRYATDLCRVLDAEATSADGSVTAVYNGGGTLSSLKVNKKSDNLNEILASITSATQRAHDRLCTLAAAKTGQLRKEAQTVSYIGLHHTDMGGRHGRTYLYAFDKALEELEKTKTVNDLQRDEKEVDRFASTTHPEQRRTRFNQHVGLGNLPLDEVDPSRQSTWGNSV